MLYDNVYLNIVTICIFITGSAEAAGPRSDEGDQAEVPPEVPPRSGLNLPPKSLVENLPPPLTCQSLKFNKC